MIDPAGQEIASQPGQYSPDPYDDFFVLGDYHLKSAGWRWDAIRNRWTYDTVTSRCVDAGNPGCPLADEPLAIPDDPDNLYGHNLRINMGAYGGTPQASMPPYDFALLADITNTGICALDDFAALVACWSQTNPNLPADFDHSSLVDLIDFALLNSDWLHTTTWH